MSEASGAELMPIGRFSDMTRLSIKALRLYDEMGLLSPAQVDDRTGYRFYRANQANRANAIRLLRSVDMPLAEIGRVLDLAPETRSEVLRAHRRRLDETLARHQQMLNSFMDILEGRKQLMPYEITVEETADTIVAATTDEVDLEGVGAAIGRGFGAIAAATAQHGANVIGAPFVVFHDVIDEETSGRIEICMPVDREIDDANGVTTKLMPAETVATAIHRGAYAEVTPVYHALSDWMGANGYDPAGPPREAYLNDPNEVAEGDQLTKVSWPIHQSGS